MQKSTYINIFCIFVLTEHGSFHKLETVPKPGICPYPGILQKMETVPENGICYIGEKIYQLPVSGLKPTNSAPGVGATN